MGQYCCICTNCGEVILADSEVEAEVIADAIAEDGCEACGGNHGAEVSDWE